MSSRSSATVPSMVVFRATRRTLLAPFSIRSLVIVSTPFVPSSVHSLYRGSRGRERQSGSGKPERGSFPPSALSIHSPSFPLSPCWIRRSAPAVDRLRGPFYGPRRNLATWDSWPRSARFEIGPGPLLHGKAHGFSPHP